MPETHPHTSRDTWKNTRLNERHVMRRHTPCLFHIDELNVENEGGGRRATKKKNATKKKLDLGAERIKWKLSEKRGENGSTYMTGGIPRGP